MQEPTKHSDPRECGARDFAMDVMENAPFASVGGTSKKRAMEAPWYILPGEREIYLKAYAEAAEGHYGPGWASDFVATGPTPEIAGARALTAVEQQDAILKQIEAFSETHAKYVYGNKLHLSFRPTPEGFTGSIYGTPLKAATLWELVHQMREDIRKTLANKRTEVLARHRDVIARLDAADDAIRDELLYAYPNGDPAIDLEQAREQRIQRELADQRAAPPPTPVAGEPDEAWKVKLDSIYEERNLVVLLLARLAGRLGWPVGLKQHDPADTAWEDEWRTILFIESPAGQLSWHLHDSEKRLVEYVAPYEKEWDKHTTEEKYARVRALLDQRTNLGEIHEGSTFFRTTKEFEVRALRAEEKAKRAEAELQKYIDEPKRGMVLELNAMMDNDRRVIASLKDVNARLSAELAEVYAKLRGLVADTIPGVNIVADPSMPKDQAVMFSPGHTSNPSITIHGIGTDKSG